MSLRFFYELGLAGILLFIGVSLGVKARPRLESPLALATRFSAVGLAAAFFLLYVAPAVGLSLSLKTVLDWIAARAERLVQTCLALF